MKKKISFKMWISVFFGGIWQLICNVFSWKNKTPFWRVIWATITVCVLIVTGMICYSFFEHYTQYDGDEYWTQYDPQLSANFRFRNNGENEGKSYIYDTRTKKRMLTGIDWIAVPEDGDSLIIVAKDGKRGFVNRFTAETVIPFRYDAAWSFTDGVAAVCEDDSVYFIDHSGSPINDRKYARVNGYGNYVYHGDYVAIPEDGRYGLVGRDGEWAVLPDYSNILSGARNMWYVWSDEKKGVIDTKARIVIPVEYENVWIHRDGGITVADASDHSQSRYDYDGTLIDKFIFDEVYEMSYYINAFDDEGNQKRAVDSLLKYSAGNYYGVMTRGGVPVTPPLYSEIECVNPGIYQCRVSPFTTDCIMVDDKGMKINE